jgi:hypothetical protein
MPARAAVLLVLALAPPASAQTVTLAAAPRPGDSARFTLELKLTGEMILTENGAKQPVKIEATARHRFAEITLAVAEGLPARSARWYDEAAATATVGGDKSDRALPADRRLVVAARNPDGVFGYCPAGPVTRDDLDLVTEHFDPHCLAGLLPGKAVAVGDTWPVADPAAQAAGLLDGVTKNTLQGKLTAAADGRATFAVTGTVEGVENGAKVVLVVDATGTFDAAAGAITELAWKQTDDRAAGPVTPAATVAAAITLRREAVGSVPAALAADQLAALPADIPAAARLLKHPGPGYELLHPRDWHVTGQTDSHLILRLLDGGEFVAQATVSRWTKAAPGRHTPADEFKKAASSAPGWTPARVTEDGELKAAAGYWVYRLTAEGRAGDVPVVRAAYLVAGPGGDQVVVTVVTPADRVRALAGRDAGLAAGITFGR